MLNIFAETYAHCAGWSKWKWVAWQTNSAYIGLPSHLRNRTNIRLMLSGSRVQGHRPKLLLMSSVKVRYTSMFSAALLCFSPHLLFCSPPQLSYCFAPLHSLLFTVFPVYCCIPHHPVLSDVVTIHCIWISIDKSARIGWNMQTTSKIWYAHGKPCLLV